jgi:uncharacterized protein YgiM (DUF1202 family)
MHIRRLSTLAAAAATIALPVLAAPAAHATPTHTTTLTAPAYYCNDAPGPWKLYARALRIHSRPSTTSTVVGVLYKGQKWRVNSWTRTENWVNITDLSTGVRGWVSGAFLYRIYPVCLD